MNNAVKVLILGYGIRGRTYAAYAADHAEDLEIAGLADPVATFPAEATYPTWKRWEDALASGAKADAVIIALPDHLHYAACLKALQAGYHVLLEKPIGCNWKECQEIRAAQVASGKLVLTGYVLRYTPLFKRLHKVLEAGVIGKLTSVHVLVEVSYGKSAHAYCRGNWSVEENGTGMLVNKCTHDFDLIVWWMRGRVCEKVSSFGALIECRPENKPEGAADRCKDCPPHVRRKCPFDAYKLYYEHTDLRYHFADPSDAGILKMIETSPYGRCVYACGNDSVDHQTVLMLYDGGLTVTLEMESFSQRRARTVHFYGTRGEIVVDDEKIVVIPFLGDARRIEPEQHGHHGGGDREIMTSFVELVRENPSPERCTAILDEALESHRLAFLAEESRYTGRTMDGRSDPD